MVQNQLLLPPFFQVPPTSVVIFATISASAFVLIITPKLPLLSASWLPCSALNALHSFMYLIFMAVRDQIANICWITEKARVPERHLFMLY